MLIISAKRVHTRAEEYICKQSSILGCEVPVGGNERRKKGYEPISSIGRGVSLELHPTHSQG